MKKLISLKTFLCINIVSIIFLAQNVQPQEISNSIKSMTFNIRLDTPNDGKDRWELRKENFISMINFYDPDILGTQEVLNNQKEYLDENLTEYKSIGVGREDGKKKGEYSAIYFKQNRFTLIDQGTFWLSETPNVAGSKSWDAAIERIATWTILMDKKNDSLILVVNTHFDHIGEQARLMSAKLIMEKMNEMNNNLATILMGDFNITEDTEPYIQITSEENFKLFDAFKISKNPHHGPAWTFNGFQENISEKVKIDFIFVNEKFSVLKHAILSDKFDGGYPSDHFPVYAELLIK